jgi:tight adherence protein C
LTVQSDPTLLIPLLAVFGSVALATGVVLSYVVARTAPERRRLEQVARVSATGVLVDAPKLTAKENTLAKRVVGIVPRSPKEMTRLRKRFARAGHDTLVAVAVYTVARMVLPIALGLAPLLLDPFDKRWMAMVAGALLGMQLPQSVLQYLITKRQHIIENGLPDALDLLIVCIEAGSAIDQAIVKVGDELAIAYPPLAFELRMVVTETRAGKRRVDAFRSFAERTGVEDVRSLVAMLVQTDRFGTSISQALRTQAETSRIKRRQKAEEAAAKMGVKLVFPLVLLLFPAFFVVSLGPAVIAFVKVFSQ